MRSKRAESCGSWRRMSSELMKMLSRCIQVRCTSNHTVMTWSATLSRCCHSDTSLRKCATNLDVMRFCSCTCGAEGGVSVRPVSLKA